MRFIMGLVVGIFLTIGAAYVGDAMHAAPGPDDKGTAQRMVNWSAVGENLRGVSSGVQNAWSRLVGGAKEIDKNIKAGTDKSGT